MTSHNSGPEPSRQPDVEPSRQPDPGSRHEYWTEMLGAHDRVRDVDRREAPIHAPQAAVLCCADARVSPAAIFDAEPGELFVVRVAGNTAGPAARASLDYAVASLGVDLVIVLGHSGCGAVGAACAGVDAAHLAAVVEPIAGLIGVGEAPTVDEIVTRNVVATVTELGESPSPIGESIRAGAVTAVGAVYDLAEDRVIDLTA